MSSPGEEGPASNTGRTFRWGRDDPTARDPRAIGSLRGAETGPSLDCGGNKSQGARSPASPAPRRRSQRDSGALYPLRTPGTRQGSGTPPPLPRSPERVLAPHGPLFPPTTRSKLHGSTPRSLSPPHRRPQPARTSLTAARAASRAGRSEQTELAGGLAGRRRGGAPEGGGRGAPAPSSGLTPPLRAAWTRS